MLTSFEIREFKKFERLELALAPLTVVTGMNGAGKSSVVQALLLSHIADASDATDLPLNGVFGLELGPAEEVRHAEATDDEIVFVASSPTERLEIRAGVPDGYSLHLAPVARIGARGLLARRGSGFTYLSSERLGPRDLHEVRSAARPDLNVGHQGQFTAQVLADLERDEVRPEMRHPSTEEEGIAVTLRAQSERWLGDIVQPIQLNAAWIPGVSAATIRFRPAGSLANWMRPSNVGFGFSYALPIVVAGLTAQRDGFVLVENPEAHLHPIGQSAIGRFLARLAAGDVQVVVETHSDHVINGIRRAVAEGLLPAERAGVHYFPASGPVSTLTISASGAMNEWPSGFFDQIEQDLAELSRLRKARRSP